MSAPIYNGGFKLGNDPTTGAGLVLDDGNFWCTDRTLGDLGAPLRWLRVEGAGVQFGVVAPTRTAKAEGLPVNAFTRDALQKWRWASQGSFNVQIWGGNDSNPDWYEWNSLDAATLLPIAVGASLTVAAPAPPPVRPPNIQAVQTCLTEIVNEARISYAWSRPTAASYPQVQEIAKLALEAEVFLAGGNP